MNRREKRSLCRAFAYAEKFELWRRGYGLHKCFGDGSVGAEFCVRRLGDRSIAESPSAACAIRLAIETLKASNK